MNPLIVALALLFLADSQLTNPSLTEAQESTLRAVNEVKAKARDRITQNKNSIRQVLEDLVKDEQVQTQCLAELDQLEATASQAKSKLDTILKKL